MLREPLVDTHVHLWDLARMPYPWLEELPQLRQTNDLNAYDAAIGEAPIETMVFVECTESFDDAVSRKEVRWASSLAEQDDRLQGIVAHASLEKGRGARDQLNWLAEQPRVQGIRRLLQDETEEFFRQPELREGLRLLADYGFSFDLTIRAPQLPLAIDLVDRCPNVQFVLDHLGKPNIREGAFDRWGEHLSRLAEREQVMCKLSGVLTEADHSEWTPGDVRPYIEHALDCFGMDRVLFGGDWPVLRLAADYPTWLEVVESVLQPYSDAERRKILSSNAERVYDLS